jgi:predicted DNA-binding protein with PD1-like motif
VRAFRIPVGFFLRLDRGEDLPARLLEFFSAEAVGAATLSGIGAIEQTTLGYYDLERREYVRRDYPESMELVSLTGNLAWEGEQPILHMHAVIAGPDGAAHGGHLFAARISATGELTVWTSGERRERKLDSGTGLKLIADP